MPHLYINSKGQPWRKHSYSAGMDFDANPYRYYLRRILGWKERDNKGSFAFGRALEEAIQHHHDNDGVGAVDAFTMRWDIHKDNKEMTYTKVERDWDSLRRTGIEMIKLYIIRQPSLPIPLGAQTIFQREISKEMFPNDEHFSGIEFAGKLDIIAYVDPEHPLLPRLNWRPEFGPFRPVILDIKTSAVDFPEQYGVAAYDLQLRAYSFLLGVRDVGFVWFVKKGHSLQKGSSVTLLEDVGMFKAGQEAVVAQIDEEDVILVANDFMIEEMEKAQGKKPDGKTDQTKVAKERRDVWLQQFGVKVPSEIVTKQRLQFNAGFVTPESAQDAGEIAARQIVNIVQAWNSNKWPQTGGVRFPKNDLGDPYFRAFVLNDESFRNANFTKSDEASLDDLFQDVDQEAE